ncbi:MAG: hypothetical protein R2838_26765 [Caldilineaceae bacterium]
MTDWTREQSVVAQRIEGKVDGGLPGRQPQRHAVLPGGVHHLDTLSHAEAERRLALGPCRHAEDAGTPKTIALMKRDERQHGDAARGAWFMLEEQTHR